MPKYRVTLSDGRKVTVEADAPPSEEDVLGALGGDTPDPFAAGIAERKPTAEEDSFFKSHPHVAGMAAQDDQVVRNPYSTLSAEQQDAVMRNERSRVVMGRDASLRPTFALTAAQRQAFQNYSADENDIRQTIVGRILSGDTSAGEITPEQRVAAQRVGDYMQKRGLFESPAPKAQPPPSTFANEPTAYGEGFKKSVKESLSPAGLTKTLTGWAGGAVSGAAQMVNPLQLLRSGGAEHERMRAEATGEQAPSTDYGMSDVKALGDSLSTPEGIGELTGATMMGLAGPRLVTKIPAARRAVGGAIERAGTAMEAGGPTAALTRHAIGTTAGAVVGGPVGAAIGGAASVAAPAVVRGTGRLIRGRVAPVEPPIGPGESMPGFPRGGQTPAPPLAAEVAPMSATPLAAEGPMLGPLPKPKLSAKETAAMLRDMHGSEQAGRMLWGKVQKQSGPGSAVSSAAERRAAIKALTPEGVTKLPSAPTRDIAARLATSSPAEAVAYANKAPNAIARDYFGEQLTAAAGDLAPGSAAGPMAIERSLAEAQLRAALLARLQAK